MSSDVAVCKEHVLEALEANPAVKLLVLAMQQSGCDFDPGRHLACEPCEGSGLDGGYDVGNNQVSQ